MLNTIILNRQRKLNHKNYTPLHIVAYRNQKEIGEILITRGANINAKDIIYQIIIILFLMKQLYNI